MLAPSIPYGVSTLAIGWPGTVSLSVPTLRRLIVEVVAGPREPRLPPAWFDFRRALARGARNFRGLGPGGAGDGWPAVARAKTGCDAMALRSRLIARRLLHSLGKRSRSETGPVLDHVGAAR